MSSNVTFEHNLVFEAGGTRFGSGAHRDPSSPIYDRAGHSLVIRNNTFLGLNRLVGFNSQPSGHVIRGNVIQGLDVSMSERSWDEIGYISEQVGSENSDVAASALAMNNDFDDNCFVTETEDFIAYGRRYEGGLDHLSLDDAREVLGYELSSVFGEAVSAFEDFVGQDYRVDPNGPCAVRGAAVPEWFR